MLIRSSVEDGHSFRFNGLGRVQTTDPNEFGGHGPGVWRAEQFYAGNAYAGALLLPMDSRTTASAGGTAEYAFYRLGGWSWSIRYTDGAYARPARVRPDITPDEFRETALQTRTTIDIQHDGRTFSIGRILNLEALITALRVP